MRILYMAALAMAWSSVSVVQDLPPGPCLQTTGRMVSRLWRWAMQVNRVGFDGSMGRQHQCLDPVI
jgi:hypothetical protein